MRKSLFTEAPFIGILKQAETGRMVTDLCREHGITQATFYRWRSKYGGMEVAGAQELNRLLDENRRLKQLVADLSLDVQVLKHVLGKKRRSPLHVVRECRLAVMLQRLGERVNAKRVYRLYREEQLHLRRKRHRKRIVGPRGALLPCSRPNQRWSLDFMTDSLGSGRKFRMFNVIDDCTRECLCIEVSTGFSGRHVTRVLERLCQQLGRPKVIRSDNGSEFTGKASGGVRKEASNRRKFRRECKAESFLW